MNILINFISLFIQSIVTFYFCISLAKCFAKKQITKKSYAISYICILATIVILSLSNLREYNYLLNTALSLILPAVIISYNFKISILKGLLISFLHAIFLGISESITFPILNHFFHFTSEMILNSSKYMLVFILLQTLLNLMIISIFNVITFKKFNLQNYLDTLSMKNIRLLLIILAAYIFPQIIIFAIKYYSYPLSLLLINTLQLLLVSILIFFYFKNILKNQKMAANYSNMEWHNKTLSKIVDSVRIQKHDYNNTIQALNGYIATKQYDKLPEFINSLTRECNNINTLSVIDPMIINEPSIYGIVCAKYFIADKNDIKYDIEILSDISKISFPKPELSRIIGILLDNAIEATQKIQNKYVKLEIRYDSKKSANLIRIINTFDTTEDINLTTIYEKGVSSKKVKSGLGLWEVKKLVSKQKNAQIFPLIENNIFIQTLIIEDIE